MKKRLSLILLSAVVAGQLAWLGYNYHARSVEIAAAPTLTVECEALDPRDVFRGDYVRFSCQVDYPLTDPLFSDLLHWNEQLGPSEKSGQPVSVWVSCPDGRTEYREVPAEQIKAIPARPATNTGSIAVYYNNYSRNRIGKLAGFWQPEDGKPATLVRVVKAGSAQDAARPGEMRTAMEGSVSTRVEHVQGEEYAVKAVVRLFLCVSDRNDTTSFRFYVPENTGEPVEAWREGAPGDKSQAVFPHHRIRTTVDFACREQNGLIVKQLYLNSIPWVDAIEKMRHGTFPLLPEPKKEVYWLN